MLNFSNNLSRVRRRRDMKGGSNKNEYSDPVFPIFWREDMRKILGIVITFLHV